MKNIKRHIQIFTCSIFLIIGIGSTAQAQERSDSAELERKALRILRSNAESSEKAIACKLLAVHGTSSAVSEIAVLLPDPQLSSWARIALEAIPGKEADNALLKAIDEVKGELLVGVINSIGVKENSEAVERLAKLLQSSDSEVASAAAVALGRIGGSAALATLQPVLTTDSSKLRSAAAEGCILIAEDFQASGELAEAIQVFDQVRNADLPKQRIIEATRAAVLARKANGIELLIEQLRSKDKKRFQLGLALVREFEGNGIDEPLAKELSQADQNRAVLIIQAISDRGQSGTASVILTAATQGDKQVRLSAIDALSRIGDVDCIDSLLQIATGSDADLSAAAKTTLFSISGASIDRKILALFPDAKGKSFVLLIELVGQRRLQATKILLRAVEHEDQSVRHAALVALGETVTPNELNALISLAVKPQQPADAPIAQKALLAASVRMPDQDACATQLSQALEQCKGETKGAVLEILGAVGGKTALTTIGRAAKSDDSNMQDVGSRLLGKWNSLDAAPILMDLARNSRERKYKIRALRGYIGLARKFDMPHDQRATMCRQAFETATRPDEQKLVLNVLQIRPSREAFQLAIDAMKVEDVKIEAMQAVLNIAQKLGGKNVDLSQLVKDADLPQIELKIVKAEYGAGSKVRDVTEIIAKHASDLPLIILPSSQYNTSFGGDPVPGVVKQLKIRYRVNGKIASATFPENAPILLPMPKR